MNGTTSPPTDTNGVDTLTTKVSWGVLVVFTILSCHLNAVYARAHGEDVIYHVAIPVLALMAGLFAELIFLSSVHWTARLVTGTFVTIGFGATMVASYIAVRGVVLAKFTTFPHLLNDIISAFPDGFMVSAATVLLAQRWTRIRAAKRARVEQPEQQEYLPHGADLIHDDAFDDADEEQFVEQETPPREAPRDALQERLDMILEALKEQSEEQTVPLPDAVHEPVEAQSVTQDLVLQEPVHEAPLVHPEPIRELVAEVKRPAADPFMLTVDADELASRIAAETTISLPVRSIAAVLKRAAAGESQRKIASALKGVSPTTVGRVISAARELQDTPQRELTAA